MTAPLPNAPRDGKPRGVYGADPAGAIAALPPSLDAGHTTLNPGLAEEEPDDGMGSPREAFERLGDAAATIPDWIKSLTARLGLSLDAARVLTGAEVNKLRPVVVGGLEQLWNVLDYSITHTNRRHAEAEIWRTTPDEVTEKLADLLLKQARSAVATAVIVRAVADAYEKYEVLAALGINSYRSIAHYWLNGGFTLLFAREALRAAFADGALKAEHYA